MSLSSFRLVVVVFFLLAGPFIIFLFKWQTETDRTAGDTVPKGAFVLLMAAIDNSAAQHLLQIREMPNSSLSPEPLASHCPNEAQNNAHSRQFANPESKQVPLDLSRADMIALNPFSSDRVKERWLREENVGSPYAFYKLVLQYQC
ncbi:hypothetical protein Q8A67_020247 [Cirrhinus molitorella]|uniref:Uncharacterized protein n=1 Tax=Cirrhinus molitorella TaxID=172907 RepID=A0AA88PD31_9TELE|nr:hypothetical protein Q8A67_020247 [Cirrhinus molitorella]